MMTGMFFAKNPDGSYSKISEVTEINTTQPEDLGFVVSEPHFTELVGGTFEGHVTIDFRPNKNAKKIWGKILGIPKFMVTEWCFPRKKKRGTKRRIRKAYRQISKTFELEEKTWMI